MQKFSFSTTSMERLILIEPMLVTDQRGYFSKVFEKQVFADHNIHIAPYEELLSCSQKGVLRGMHFQREYSQDKLVRVLHGKVFDVAVDLRYHSPTFGKWEGFVLSAENRKMLYIPKGFAHGFLALEDHTLFSYLCGERYDPASDGGIRWDDPDVGICWPLEQVDSIILSDKDQKLPTFAQFCSEHKALMYGDYT